MAGEKVPLKSESGGIRSGVRVPLEAIAPRRLYRQVADQLRTLIDQGEYPVGGRLPTERELAEQLGVSRPTVREALIALAVEGRLRIRVGSGIYVVEPPAVPTAVDHAGEGPFEVLATREFLEAAVAAEAARRATPLEIAEIDEILARMQDAENPSEEAIVLDRAFHITLAGIAGNSVLVRIVGDLFDQRITPFFRQLASYFENRESWAAAHREHRAIRDRIAARDPDGAHAAMREHMRRSQERFSATFGEGGPAPSPPADRTRSRGPKQPAG